MSSHRTPFLLNAIDEAQRTISRRPATPNAQKLLREASLLRATVESWRHAPPTPPFREGVMQRVLRLHTEAARCARPSARPPDYGVRLSSRPPPRPLSPFALSPSVRPPTLQPSPLRTESQQIRVPPPVEALVQVRSQPPFSLEPTPARIDPALAADSAPEPVLHPRTVSVRSATSSSRRPDTSESNKIDSPRASPSATVNEPNRTASAVPTIASHRAGKKVRRALLVFISFSAVGLGGWVASHSLVSRMLSRHAATRGGAMATAAPTPAASLDKMPATPPTASPTESAPSSPVSTASVPLKTPAPMGSFDRAAAQAAIDVVSAQLAECKLPKRPAARAHLTFAPDGSVSSAKALAPYGGTRPGACVSAHLKQVRVAPFRGPAVPYVYTFSVTSR
jgi:hypothetical protein